MVSLWLDRSSPVVDDPLPLGVDGDHPDRRVDDVVVGAGLTGLTTALLLARAGRRVAVLEARTVGAGATGNTTAKVSLLQGTHLSRVRRHQSREVSEAYVEANREGQAWLLRFLGDHGVGYERRPAATYAAETAERGTVEKEHDVATELGLEVEWQERMDVPFPFHGATVLPDQAQIDPWPVLATLVEQLRAHGGTVHQGQRVVGASVQGAGVRVRLGDGSEVHADQVVLATGIPVLDRGLYFAKVEPQRSYALAFDPASETPLTETMYLSAGSDSRSVRDAPGRDGGRSLLIGGSGHTVGRTRSELEHVQRLREWTAAFYPGTVETHQWSAQDYAPHDAIPFVGPMPRGGGRIHVATGFEKWGMSNGVAAARSISGRILGEEPSWATALHHRLTGPRGAAELGRINAGVGLALTGGLLRSPARLPAARRDCGVVALCTHLGGVLKWNDAERSWDCPLHGSRFTPEGEVVEGPATRPLARRDTD